MDLLEGESIILESDTKELKLTTHRVRHHKISWGQEDVVSIMLDEVASCGLIHTSNPMLIVLSAACGIAAVAGPDRSRILLLLATAILLIAYFATRKHVLAIGTAGHTLRVTLEGMNSAKVLKFIDETEAAKNRRYFTRVN